jgi:hypothetical protein
LLPELTFQTYDSELLFGPAACDPSAEKKVIALGDDFRENSAAAPNAKGRMKTKTKIE